jgi:hypothetical protein
MVVDLLAVADVFIEASEARAQLLDSCNKGPSKKKQQEDQELNTAYRGNHKQQPTEQKENRLFYRPANAKRWCKIHHTTWHDMEECKTFLDLKKMLEKPAA